jgi:hypothetical protein
VADKWTIYSRERVLGPWTAQQVRAELRAGRIDPFDMVSREGQAVKRPLVEIDEIFLNSKVQMAAVISEADSNQIGIDQNSDQFVVGGDTKVSSLPIEPDRVAAKPVIKEAVVAKSNAPASGASDRPRQFQSLAAADRVEAPRPSSGKRQYLVVDSTGRTRGPLTSSEVLMLWERGMIDSRALVKKLSPVRAGVATKQPSVSITQFIRAYQQTYASDVAFLSQMNRPLLVSRDTAKSFGNPLFILVLAVAIGGVIFLAKGPKVKMTNKGATERTAKTERAERADDSWGLTLRQGPLKRPESARPEVSPSKAPTEIPSLKAIPQDVAQIVIGGESNSSERIDLTPAPRQPTSPGFERDGSSDFPKKNRPLARKARPIAPRPLFQARASVAPVTAAPRPNQGLVKSAPFVPPPASVARTNTMAPVGGPVDGATIRLVGYSMGRSDLLACQIKCKITVSGPQGPYTAVFFKEAFVSVLQSKVTGLSIVGTLRLSPAGGRQIIVSGIK